MAHKAFTQVSVFVLLLLAFFGTPLGAQAGGVCGGTYVVEGNDTLDSIAAMCGITISAINAANPGINGSLYAGQVLTLPGNNYNNNYNNNNYNNNNYNNNNYNNNYDNNYNNNHNNDYNNHNNDYNNYNYYAPVSYNGTYIVRVGDTFSGIASRYGVSLNDLRAANPYIWDINNLYAGQVIYVPGSSLYPYMSTPPETPSALSYGTVPSGTPKGSIILLNKANADVYVSLQGTTRDGSNVINEYSVSGSMKVNVPAGWYIYVAWVGGQKFEGQFHLSGDSDHGITFYSNKIVVE